MLSIATCLSIAACDLDPSSPLEETSAEVKPEDGPPSTDASIAVDRPLFQLPFPCGQRWVLFSYDGHNPDDRKIDMQRLDGGTSGSPVVAAYGGVVHSWGTPGGIEINHGGGWFSLYLHMTNRSVQPGQTVQQGQQIGLTGNVGTGVAHLHYELRFDANGNGDSTNSEIVVASFNGVLYNMGANGERSFNVTSNNCGSSPPPSAPLNLDVEEKVDLNGDGRADLCGRAADGVHCALATGTTFGSVTRWTGDFSNAGGWHQGPQYYSTIALPDVNGDGRADVCGRGSPGIYCALSSGTGFGAATVWTANFTDAGGWTTPHYYSTIRYPDVNGDGRADVCGRGSTGIHCALSTGAGFGAPTLWTANFTDAGGWTAPHYYSTIRFPDANGDGRADVCGRGGTGIHCALSTGTGFGAPTLWTANFTDAGGWNQGPHYYGTIRFIDLDADGRADICGRGSLGIHCALSSGSAYGPVTLWTDGFANAGSWHTGPQYYSTIRFADMNGDDRADVCGRGTPGIYCALSTGAGFGTPALWTNNFTDAGGWNLGPHYYATIRLPDLNGDGRADICGRGSPGIYCSLSSGGAFGSVDLWTSNFGDADGWAEAPYYSTIRFP
jgi:hypothetical protein